MTTNQVKEILDKIGYPVTYDEFSVPVSPPFISYLIDNVQNLFADNQIVKTINSYRVELYTEKKDFIAELKVENVFKNVGILYSKRSISISNENLHQTIYEFEEME